MVRHLWRHALPVPQILVSIICGGKDNGKEEAPFIYKKGMAQNHAIP